MKFILLEIQGDWFSNDFLGNSRLNHKKKPVKKIIIIKKGWGRVLTSYIERLVVDVSKCSPKLL